MIQKVRYKLYGAILGDLAGQPYEFPIMKGPYTNVNIHNQESHITDDSLMTLASANFLLGKHDTIEEAYKDMGNRYQGDYYGKGFKKWLSSEKGIISDSYGNGCLMRLSPFMYIKDKEQSKKLAIESCICSHLHPISIISVMDLIHEYSNSGLRRIATKYGPHNSVKKFEKFEVIADKTVEFIKNAYWLKNTTQEAIIAAIECGGDTDTNASILGELMNYTFNDIRGEDVEYVDSKLDEYQLNILKQFNKKFNV